MSREKTFSFIPENQLNKVQNGDTFESVSISTKGLMYFSRSYVNNYDLKNCFVRMYADPVKKVIAWSIFRDSDSISNTNLKLRKLTPLGPSQEIKLSVGKILKSIGVKTTKARLKLPVKKYEDLLEKKTFFYVDLN